MTNPSSLSDYLALLERGAVASIAGAIVSGLNSVLLLLILIGVIALLIRRRA